MRLRGDLREEGDVIARVAASRVALAFAVIGSVAALNGQAGVATARSATPWPGRTRPLCAYPRQARYAGHGSIEHADSFACR